MAGSCGLGQRERQPLPEPEVAQAPRTSPCIRAHTTPPRNVGWAVGNPVVQCVHCWHRASRVQGANSNQQRDFCGPMAHYFSEGRVQL